MDIPSVPAIQFLVNYVSLCWHHQRRLPASRLWWLWLLTVVIHLWLTISALALASSTPAPGDQSAISTRWSAERPYLVGGMVLMLVLRPSEASPFPWSRRWRVRLVFRRRRLADLGPEELIALLPAGLRTIAQLVDWLTRSQMVKLLAAIPILYPILAELDVEAIIDKYCPTEAEVNIGTVILILCLNRLTAPHPLSGIADWAAKTVIEELTGVPASKLNDDRLARALDAIYPHLKEIWAEIAGQALIRYRIDLSLVFYDLTAFYFEGEYKNSTQVTFGYSRKQKGKKQRKLALNVTAQERFPFLYELLDGNTADVSTVQANMQRLLTVLREQGWPVDTVMVVGDRAMLSAEIVFAYHRANLKYLGALKVMGETEKVLIRSVSEAELQKQRLSEDHYGVKRPYSFEHDGQSITDVALVTLSRPLRRKQRCHRAEQIRQHRATLQAMTTERLNQRKYKRKVYAEEQIQKQVLSKPGGEFLQVELSGEEGHLSLSWRVDVKALKEAMILDGKFLLITNDPALSGAEMVARYGDKDKVEKRFRTVKGPIQLRPIFLHRDDRIESLVFVNMLALLVYSVLEIKCKRQGLAVTGEAVLKAFTYLAVVYTTFADNSVLLRVEELSGFQRKVVQALGQSWWPAAAILAGSMPSWPRRAQIPCPRPNEMPSPVLS
jgi:transposase